jgi:hypothetical protein
MPIKDAEVNNRKNMLRRMLKKHAKVNVHKSLLR